MLIIHPEGYLRSVDTATGAVSWAHPDDPNEANRVLESGPFWNIRGNS